MANRKDKTQTTSAAKAGFSECFARRIESVQRQLGPIKTRGYRTRTAPSNRSGTQLFFHSLNAQCQLPLSVFLTIFVKSMAIVFHLTIDAH